MKTLLLIPILLALSLPAFAADAGSAIAELLGNQPNVPFTEAKLELNSGAVMHGASSFGSVFGANYNYSTNFYSGGEFQTGTGVTTFESVTLFPIGYRKVWPQTEFYATVGPRRNFAAGAWEGFGLVGVAYKPLTNLTGVALYFEQGVAVSIHGQPVPESRTGLRFTF